ncbi:MAG: hypothetical protein OXC28_06915 [Defluviicoccus sp.]|nr:hypothetical protein [Defluviicoccus sp.]
MTAVLAAVREFGSHLAELKRTIESASAWSSSIRAINDKLQQAVGSDLRAVEAGRLDLGKVVAALKLREEGLKEQHEAIDKGVDALRALWKSADQRLKELTSKTQALADRYEAFTTESKAHRTAIAALSRDLRDGGADLRESVTKNRQAQFAILERTLGNVREFKEQNDGFLERLDESGEALLEAIRREWTATRRWAVPALAAALVLAVPSFAVVGAYAQSEFRIFRPYDETRGWRQGVWESHGETVKNCMLESLRTKRVVRCGFDVEYF